MSGFKVEATLGDYLLVAAPNGTRRYPVHVLGPNRESVNSDTVNLSDAAQRRRFCDSVIPEAMRAQAGPVLLQLGARVDAARMDAATAGQMNQYQDVTTVDDVVRVLNEEYAVVLAGNQPAVLRERTNEEGLRSYALLSIDGFSAWLRAQKILVGGKPTSFDKIWLDDPRRRQYEGLTFAPGRETPGYYNLWTGFAVSPSPAGSCQRFLDHVRENVCSNDEAIYRFVIRWLAETVQRPEQKSGKALALRGAQGVGKTIVGKAIRRLLGPHYALFSEARYITGRFNAHLLDLLVLHLDEATWGGDHAAAGRLKDLITNDWQHVELKGREPMKVRNLVRVLITGNADWLVPAGQDERRFVVLDVAPTRQQDRRYFKALEDEMDAGGSEALLHYLMTFDIDAVPVDLAQETSGLFEQKLASLSSPQQWWHDLLASGVLPGDENGVGVAPVAEVYAAYVEHAKQIGKTRRAMETEVGIFLGKVAPGLVRTRRMLGSGSRVYLYEFPPLAACRAAWCDSMRTRGQWDERDEWGAWVPTTSRRT